MSFAGAAADSDRCFVRHRCTRGPIGPSHQSQCAWLYTRLLSSSDRVRIDDEADVVVTDSIRMPRSAADVALGVWGA